MFSIQQIYAKNNQNKIHSLTQKYTDNPDFTLSLLNEVILSFCSIVGSVPLLLLDAFL